ncbi:MAG: hypothetical protein ACR2N6_00365, partial [Miltoncostaeaceae bacterium]
VRSHHGASAADVGWCPPTRGQDPSVARPAVDGVGVWAWSATVGVPLWGAALFFGAVALLALAAHGIRARRAERRRTAGVVDGESGWHRASAHVAESTRYVCAAVRTGGAIVEIWGAEHPDAPLPPPRDARPFATRKLEKPIDEAISLGLTEPDAEELVRRVVSSAEGTYT